jgi:transcription elongation factor Elf1
MPITPGLYRHFNCPLCQSDDYGYALYSREGRNSVRMSWFQCAGCSVMFNDPERFSRLVRRVHELNAIRDAPQRGEGPLRSESEKLQQELDEQRAIDAMNKGARRPIQRPDHASDKSTGQSSG